MVGTLGESLRQSPMQKYADSADEGWWPDKASSSAITSHS